MKKQGLDKYLTSVNVVSTANGKQVQATARAEVPFYFANFIGIDALPAIASSKARQDITDLEIILVLDVSGSMDWDDGTGKKKITGLKKAAKEFIDQMLPNEDAKEHISIGIVPYNAQVNIGPDLVAKYNVPDKALIGSNPHGRTDIHCLELPASQFSSVAVSRSAALKRMPYADTESRTSFSQWSSLTDLSAGLTVPSSFFCGPNTKAELDAGLTPTRTQVVLPTNDVTLLKSKIDGLYPSGNTSIVLGMKWGATLIDESARDMFSDFVSADKIPAVFDGRPFDYSKSDSMKIIVLMTDGNHVDHRLATDANGVNYKTGASPVWRAADGRYSVRFTSADYPTTSNAGGTAVAASGTVRYWTPHLSTSLSNGTNFRSAWLSAPYQSGGTPAVQLTWQELWAQRPMSWVAWHLFARAKGGISSSARETEFNARMGHSGQSAKALRSTWNTVSSMNSLMQQTCNQLKNPGPGNYPVKIFGIAFYGTNPSDTEAGAAQIKACATTQTDPYYFAVKPGGTTIGQAFSAIGSTISNLRLTQ